MNPYRSSPVREVAWVVSGWVNSRTWALLGGLALFAITLTGCPDTSRQIQAQTANAVAVGANATLPLLVERYRQEGLKVIDQAKTKEEAEAGLAQVRSKWAGVWKAWAALVVSEDAWASALESDQDATAALVALKVAYCGLRKELPGDIPALPLAPVLCGVK